MLYRRFWLQFQLMQHFNRSEEFFHAMFFEETNYRIQMIFKFQIVHIEIEKFAKTNKNSFRVRFFIKYNLHITDTLEIMYSKVYSNFFLIIRINCPWYIYVFQFCLLIRFFLSILSCHFQFWFERFPGLLTFWLNAWHAVLCEKHQFCTTAKFSLPPFCLGHKFTVGSKPTRSRISTFKGQ